MAARSSGASALTSFRSRTAAIASSRVPALRASATCAPHTYAAVLLTRGREDGELAFTAAALGDRVENGPVLGSDLLPGVIGVTLGMRVLLSAELTEFYKTVDLCVPRPSALECGARIDRHVSARSAPSMS